MIMYAKNAESGEQGAMKMTMDLWMAKGVPGAADFQKFYAEMAAKLGFTGHSQQSMEGMVTAFGIDPRELYKHTKDLQGMSLMSTVSLGAMADTSAQSGKQSEAKEQKKEKQSDEADEGGKSSTAKKLSGLFGKKKESKDDEASKSKDAKSEQQSGPMYLMQFTTTVTEISSAGVAASEFEVPGRIQTEEVVIYNIGATLAVAPMSLFRARRTSSCAAFHYPQGCQSSECENPGFTLGANRLSKHEQKSKVI